jgi:hypothetical protein
VHRVTSTQALTAGAWHHGAASNFAADENLFVGDIDDVRFYDAVLLVVCV